MDIKQPKSEEKLPPVLGSVPDEPDERDFKYEEVMGADPIDWVKGFDNEDKYHSLREDHQGKSLACVTFGATNDMEMAAQIKTGKEVQFSQRYIYSQIHLPNGGASNRTAMKLLNKQGVCEDKFMPTPVGRDLTESQMRNTNGLTEAKHNAAKWKIKSYYAVSTMNAMARAIEDNGGCLGGFKSMNASIGHAVYFAAYGMHKGYRGFRYHDSYYPHDKWIVTNNGNYYLDNPRGVRVTLYSMWTAEPGDWTVEEETMDIKFKLERRKEEAPILLIANNEPYWIKSGQDMENLIKATDGLISWDKVVEVDKFSYPFEGRLIGLPNLSDVVKNYISGKR